MLGELANIVRELQVKSSNVIPPNISCLRHISPYNRQVCATHMRFFGDCLSRILSFVI